MHIALMGMEKVVPTVADLSVLLTLLPRSATGQKFSSYVSWITGPRRAEEQDGPEQFHLVILDNGRSRILADAELRESLHCIRCGACLNICPVYQRVGGHAYGWVYPGPIGSIITPQYVGLDRAAKLPFASSLCGACGDICPVKIDIPSHLLKLRSRIAEPSRQSSLAAGIEGMVVRAWKYAVLRPRLWQMVIKVLRWLQMPLLRKGWLRWAPFPISRWTRSRNLHPVAKQTFTEWWKKQGIRG
jgi:L-lactate dehydrogenase complex protein LldF